MLTLHLWYFLQNNFFCSHNMASTYVICISCTLTALAKFVPQSLIIFPLQPVWYYYLPYSKRIYSVLFYLTSTFSFECLSSKQISAWVQNKWKHDWLSFFIQPQQHWSSRFYSTQQSAGQHDYAGDPYPLVSAMKPTLFYAKVDRYRRVMCKHILRSNKPVSLSMPAQLTIFKADPNIQDT